MENIKNEIIRILKENNGTVIYKVIIDELKDKHTRSEIDNAVLSLWSLSNGIIKVNYGRLTNEESSISLR